MTSRLRVRGAELGYLAGWQLVRRIPQPMAAAGFRMAADRAARRDGPGSRHLRANLARVRPEVTPAELDDLVGDALRSYARYWREAFRLPVIDPAELYTRVDPVAHGQEHLDKAVAGGRGAVLALTHSGNWDVAGVWLIEALRERGLPAGFTTVAERQRPESLHRRFVRYRESLGFEILTLPSQSEPNGAGKGAQDSHSAPIGELGMLRTLLARLRDNRVVCLLADRDLTRAGVPVRFFGAETRMPAGPARLASHTGAALLPVGCWFDGDDGWGIRIHPAIPVSADPADVSRATQDLADVFAVEIAAHPADWHVTSPFWPAQA